jgi:hypothetical protein
LRHASKDRIASRPGAIVAPMEHRDRRIVVETSRHRISGVLHMPRDGYRSRLTDYLNASDGGFLPLTEVEISPLEAPDRLERRPFMALSIAHVVLAMPADESESEA